MTLKYEITDIQHPGNPQLFQIRALRDIPLALVKAGDLGGYVENENNLSQEGNCWVNIYSRIYNNARVFENAQIYGNVCVSAESQVYGNAQVYDIARIFENAQIYGNAKVYGTAKVYGNAHVFDNAQVYGGALLCGEIQVNEKMEITVWGNITSLKQLYYADGVTIFLNVRGDLIVNGTSLDIEQHKMLARLKLS